MRKITQEEQENRSKKRRQLILALLLMFIMLFSLLGFAFSTGDRSTANVNNQIINYNGFQFQENNGFWILNSNQATFVFSYNPSQTQDITTQINGINSYYNQPLYIYSEEYNSELEITSNLNQISSRIQKACPDFLNETSNLNCGENAPSKTCTDNFIIIQKSDNANASLSLKQEGNCVFIKGPSNGLLELSDEFLFKIMGIKS